MSVGLYDADFFKYHQTIFNLEIMKLATYFKKKKQITIMAPAFAPDRYTYFYYRKDFDDGEFPTNITSYKNLKYGGLAFSNNKYVCLPEEIERCIPDKFLYERFKESFIEDKKMQQTNYTSLVRGIHFRLSLDGETVWSDYLKQISPMDKARIFFVHDNCLGQVQKAPEAIREIFERNGLTHKSALCAKFPIQCYNFEEFQRWENFIQSSIYFKLQLNWLLSDEELNYIAEKTIKSNSLNILYNPVHARSFKNRISEDTLIKIFIQTLFLYTLNKSFLLIYEDSFEIPDEIKKMFDLFSAYGRSRREDKCLTSLFYFAKQLGKRTLYTKKIMPVDEARAVFAYCQSNYPELFKLFYEKSQATFKGGKIEIE